MNGEQIHEKIATWKRQGSHLKYTPPVSTRGAQREERAEGGWTPVLSLNSVAHCPSQRQSAGPQGPPGWPSEACFLFFWSCTIFFSQSLEQKLGVRWWHLLMAQSWEAPALQREYLYLEELDNIECWHVGNGMKFNSGKYKVMHLGLTNKNLCCKLGAHQMEMTEEEKNLGVFVDLKMTELPIWSSSDEKHTSTEIFPGEGENVNTIIQSSAAAFSAIMHAARVTFNQGAQA